MAGSAGGTDATSAKFQLVDLQNLKRQPKLALVPGSGADKAELTNRRRIAAIKRQSRRSDSRIDKCDQEEVPAPCGQPGWIADACS